MGKITLYDLDHFRVSIHPTLALGIMLQPDASSSMKYLASSKLFFRIPQLNEIHCDVLMTAANNMSYWPVFKKNDAIFPEYRQDFFGIDSVPMYMRYRYYLRLQKHRKKVHCPRTEANNKTVFWNIKMIYSVTSNNMERD